MIPLEPSSETAAGADRRSLGWALFHLNLMFSSIEESTRRAVIERCYWPLLRLAENCRFPIGVELTGHTLSVIAELDPAWVAHFRALIGAGLAEPIASGEAQLIGPLVPAAVNAANLRLGNATYERLLGLRPALVLVNEQCFSSSMIDHYIDAGYAGFLTEWENVHHAHPEWDPILRYRPGLACASSGRSLPVLWNLTVAFQKLQRLAQAVDPPERYWQWLDRQIEQRVPALNLYCNDAEIFDFRPRRFQTEPEQRGASEWATIEGLFRRLGAERRLAACRPSDVLAALPPTGQPVLTLATAAMPLPTKKQEKYNALRWAVTGRDDLGINSRCYRLARALATSDAAGDADWRELCYLYSSDFRTHITDRRWAAFTARLAAFERRWNCAAAPPIAARRSAGDGAPLAPRADGIIRLEAPHFGVELNARRGLAIHRLWLGNAAEDWLLGTIPFGHFDDISLGADFYSGHLVFQQPGKAQVTDLSPVAARLADEAECHVIRASVATALGPVEKELRLHRAAPRLDVIFRLDWPVLPLGALRLGQLTANPAGFDADRLWYATHNGGEKIERFLLGRADFDHGRPVSHIVSAHAALGMTEGVFMFGDDRRSVRITALREAAAVVPMVIWRRLPRDFFFRVAFSAAEIDDTARAGERSGGERGRLTAAFTLTLGSSVG